MPSSGTHRPPQQEVTSCQSDPKGSGLLIAQCCKGNPVSTPFGGSPLLPLPPLHPSCVLYLFHGLNTDPKTVTISIVTVPLFSPESYRKLSVTPAGLPTPASSMFEPGLLTHPRKHPSQSHLLTQVHLLSPGTNMGIDPRPGSYPVLSWNKYGNKSKPGLPHTHPHWSSQHQTPGWVTQRQALPEQVPSR